ncbi:MAG TPA: amidohydrolase [Gemmatimonadales bacterium]|nr:amidohydrolase [Gemmatimonadales bacterium]
MTATAPRDTEFAELVATRRDLHAHPELGFQEHRTAGLVAERLAALGYQVTTGVGKTGVVGVLRGTGATGSGPVRTVLLRADMDALPIQEANQVVYRSTVPGAMHACGHDAHVAVGLAVARRLAASRGNWRGAVKFAFQPAEEGGNGALAMIEDGVLENPHVDAAFGLHVMNNLPLGTIAATAGPIMGSVDKFTITIRGKGGHAAMPHEAVDPILAAAHIVAALQSMVSRAADPFDQLVVSVTQIKAGDAFNVIPETAELGGTVRSMGGRPYDEAPGRLTVITNGVASALGCSAAVEYVRQTPATINDEAMTQLVARIAAQLVGEGAVLTAARTLGGEDFSFFLRRVPGCFAWVGSQNPAKGFDAPHHSPRFDIDEAAMPTGVELLDRIAREYLR